MSNTADHLHDMVKSIANELSNGFDEDRLNWDDEPMTASDYIAEALDLTYHVGADGSFKGGEIAVTIGGPNIYVDVSNRVVEGYWGGNKASWSFTDSVGLWDEMEEFYEMTRM